MARLDVEKKRVTGWPWVIGMGLLALMIWGATTLLRADPEAEAPDIGVTAEDTLPPARIPSLPTGGAAPAGATPPPEEAAIDEDRVGEVVRTDGEVLATGNQAFWILVGSRVLRVDSPRPARKGDTISVEGTLLEADAAKTDRIASEVISRHPEYESWTVLRSLKIVEEGAQELSAREG